MDIPRNVWLKAKMFDTEVRNACHVSGTKMVTFVMNQGSKMDATLKAMKALIASWTELFPIMVESSKDGGTSSSYSDLIPQGVVDIQGAAATGGNQPMEEDENQLEDITAFTAPPVSAIEVMVSNATPVSSIVGEETLDGCHVAEVIPPSPPLTFHVIVRAPPPLAPVGQPTCSGCCGDREPCWSDFRTTWSEGDLFGSEVPGLGEQPFVPHDPEILCQLLELLVILRNRWDESLDRDWDGLHHVLLPGNRHFLSSLVTFP